MTTELVVSFELDGLHAWPEAPDRYKEFRQSHRHLFKFILYFPVDVESKNERPKELWELRQNCIYQLGGCFGNDENLVRDFKDWSCEGIAKYCIETFGCIKAFVGEETNLGAWVAR